MRCFIATTIATACVLFGIAAQAQYDVETIQSSGDPDNRVDIVIMGDGYTSLQQAKMTSDVNKFLSKFWLASPYGLYRDFFNIKLVHVVSNEDGADNGTYGASRDTALGAYYNCYNIDRLLCIDEEAVYSVQSQYMPEADFVWIIVNDPKYGGAGGSYSTFSVNEYAGEIAVHEFGHSLGGLADEYEDAYPGYPGCFGDCPEWNATTVAVRENLKWNVWVDAGTPIPTPETGDYFDVVGDFEGARYQSNGVYRPKYNCTMRSLGTSFCEVCQEGLVLSIYSFVSPLDGKLPAEDTVHILGGSSVQLEALYPTPVPDSVSFAWSVNGLPVSGSKSARVFTALGLGEGVHSVRVDISDETSLVRNNPYGTMNSYAIWTLNVDATTDTTSADTDTNPIETDTLDTDDTGTQDTGSATQDTGTGTQDTGSASQDTGSATQDTDTGTQDTGTGSATQDSDTGDPQQLCTPGSKECTGLYAWAVCSNDGSEWIPWGTCNVNEICEGGACVNEEDGGGISSEDDNCGCAAVGHGAAVSLLAVVYAIFF